MGMVGGSMDAFIGGVHRIAAAMDGEIELVCGAFSSSPEKSKATGEALYLPAERVYGSFEEMILKEKQLPEGERMDFVSIVTPNHVHFPPAKLALENGFHVVCDKPLTHDTADAEALVKVVEESGLIFCLTHNYTGYPMVKEAKHLIKSGALGTIRKVVVEYPQGWLSTLVEATGQKQASWRTDPARSGAAGGLGDIGTHAENLAEYITGLRITEVCADLTIFVEGRQLDDDANVLLRFDNGAKGILQNSQICNGEENDLNIRVYGEYGGLEWNQMEPNTLIHKTQEGVRILRTGKGNLSEAAQVHTRTPAGHPEGYLEAFANLYRNFAFALRARWEGKKQDPLYDFPTVYDGIRGMKFIDTVLTSDKTETKWTKFLD
ncbi:Gfo/Idh/MocA family protein [Arundinibacter roseus]|uniref:Gfo/Idh/MocA family oxidoreductase n=1 Tax=Arundinibacter roseus TaxID=2070510 RepID=A0A4R4K3P1_9BACT|nr:Gfo/Idh/MocA family oxidoreductase [Arundinibacter roseus]TDB61202.1 Gfo/Idh/MocA family oxidoreductase [Arundinibacter roseus]